MEKKCKACDDTFQWQDKVVIVNDNLYHKDCVTLYPIGFVAFIDDECIGETENEDGQMAFEIIDELPID